jgi:hypothetical protein
MPPYFAYFRHFFIFAAIFRRLPEMSAGQFSFADFHFLIIFRLAFAARHITPMVDAEAITPLTLAPPLPPRRRHCRRHFSAITSSSAFFSSITG